jgi:predicted nucleic-acid-binding protein
VNLTPDTNVLLRLIVNDDAHQGVLAVETLERASRIAISIHALCELVWVLRGRYAMPRADIAAAIRGLIDAENVVANRPAIDAGLTLLEAGGDFADGVIAYEGRWLGGETFASFDKGAVTRLERQGLAALLLT